MKNENILENSLKYLQAKLLQFIKQSEAETFLENSRINFSYSAAQDFNDLKRRHYSKVDGLRNGVKTSKTVEDLEFLKSSYLQLLDIYKSEVAGLSFE